MSDRPLGLFEAFGIELEYMIVDQESLDVRATADKVLTALAGHPTSDSQWGTMTWSNELALHVIELKTTEPASNLSDLAASFPCAVTHLLKIMEPLGLMLLPSACHPWMNPAMETRLWPHDGKEVYQTYDRIFDCRSHGWGNVQSVHLNLPFHGPEEFARLHAAIRVLLPILPALAASSPVVDGTDSGWLDTRMMYYMGHCDAVPALAGQIVPEAIFDEPTYRREVFEPIAEAMKPHDPQRLMETDFLNSRGAIARFDRGSIEVRVMDVQESPVADVALCAAVISLARTLCQERWSSYADQCRVSTAQLRLVLDQTSRTAEHTVIESADLLSQFGIQKPRMVAGELWQHLLEQLLGDDPTLREMQTPLQIILSQGTLASRIRTAIGDDFSRDHLTTVYRRVAGCLLECRSFES